jgi:hypothetical protein
MLAKISRICSIVVQRPPRVGAKKDRWNNGIQE